MADDLLPDPRERRALYEAAVDAIERIAERRAAAPNHVDPASATLAAALAPPSAAGQPLDEVLVRYEEAASIGWDKTSGGDFSYVPNGGIPAGIAAALLASGARGYTGAAHDSPGLVAIEESVLRWMAALVGLPEGAGGVLLSGGSLANQTAIAAARERTGGSDGSTMYVSDRVHHSVTKAARLAGVRPELVRTVATDAAGRCDPASLRQGLEADARAGHRPFLIVGVAGSTDTGSVDPLAELAEIAATAGAWFHVDAAYGGFFALTERGRSRLRGIERADSVTLDAHKSLFLPYGVGALLARDPRELVAAHAAIGAYMRDVRVAGDQDLPHYFQRGPELTRPNRGLLVWFPLQLHGTDAFARELDRMLDLASFAHERLNAVPGLVTGPLPDLSVTVFRAEAGDEATDRIVGALHQAGRFQVSTTTFGGHATIRFAFLNPATTQERVAEAIEVVERSVRQR